MTVSEEKTTEEKEQSKAISRIRYSGAEWIRKTLGSEVLERTGTPVKMSPLGVKVANILGQVYSGIYHLDFGTLERVEWDGEVIIGVVISGQMASFDGSLLTRLVLCCQAADIQVQAHGCFKHYMRLNFTNKPQSVCELFEHETFELPETLVTRYCSVKKTLEAQPGQSAVISSDGLGWQELKALVYSAHLSTIRVAIEGRSHKVLEVSAYKRTSDGRKGITKWHPSMPEHKDMMTPALNIDFSAEGDI